MYLKTLKYLQLLSGLILAGLFLAAPAVMPALYPAAYPVVPAASYYTQDPAFLILLATAAANLLSGFYQGTLSGGRRTTQGLATVLVFLAGILGAANAFARLSYNPATADAALITVSLLIAGLALHTLCNLHRLNPQTSAPAVPDGPLEDGRETGTVKWFNVSKGFGFITRDSGDDIFVHYRAIRGEGHRTLSEGQRVEFVVAEKDKGLQAEDVASTRR